jgi:hypothetical protein
MAATLFTLMSLPHLFSGSVDKGQDHGSGPPSALTAYLRLYETSHFQYGGQACDAIVAQFRLVDPNDPSIRNLGARGGALDDGRRCDADINASNQRFQALSLAMAAAGSAPTRALLDDVISAQKSLTPFDRSRPSETPVLQKAQAFIQASDTRIADFMRSVEEFQRDPAPSAVAYQHVQDALQKIDADRDRMTSEPQKSALQAADIAVQKMRDSAARFQTLATLLAEARASQDSAVQEKLIDATAAITTLDKKLANQQQQDQLRAALALVTPLAWNWLRERLAALSQASPASYTAVAAAYRLVKDQPREGLTGDQRHDLQEGASAAKKLDESEARLQSLAAAADTWRSQGVSAGMSVLAPLHSMDVPFDRLRASGISLQAWDTLTQAETILTASDRGLTAATKATTPIFVTSSRGTAADTKLARAVRDAMVAAGFTVTDSAKFTALVVDITAGETTPGHRAVDGGLSPTTTVSLDVRAVWAGNRTALPLGKQNFSGHSEVDDSGTRYQEALAAAVENVVDVFRKMTGR